MLVRRAMTDQLDRSDAPVHCIVIAPNQSLTATTLAGFYGGGLIASLAVATGLAVIGYWPILVFAVLEWIAIGFCALALVRAGRYREVITVGPREVTIEKRRRARPECVHFKRYWASVEQRASISWYPSRLTIESHGTRCEIGRCLTEDERTALKARLVELIGPLAGAPELAR
jgi:uncharacterized membrane protein